MALQTSNVSDNGFLGNYRATAGQNPFLSGYLNKSPQPVISSAPPTAPLLNGFSGNFQTSTPSTAVKSHEITSDGGVKVTYHPPEKNPSEQPTASAPVSSDLVQNQNGQWYNPKTNPELATAPAAPAQTPYSTVSQTASFPGLLGLLTSSAQDNIPIGQKAADIAARYGPRIAAIQRSMAGQIAGDRSTGTAPVGEGNAAIASQAAGSQLQGLSQAEQAELNTLTPQLTAQQQEQSGLYNAAGLAQPSGNFPFVFDPATGTFKNANGENAGLITPQQAAQALNSGQMTPEQADAAVSYLGGTAHSQLVSAMQGLNSNFNWTQAQALSSSQGTVAPLLNQAQLAIQNLQQTFASIPDWQKTGIPALNALTGLLSEIGIGTGTQKDKENAISEARTQVSNALGVATNTTPTAWTATVQGWFPDNATPAQIAAGIQQFNQLASNRQAVFGTPGQVQPFIPQNNNATSNTNPTGWF